MVLARDFAVKVNLKVEPCLRIVQTSPQGVQGTWSLGIGSETVLEQHMCGNMNSVEQLHHRSCHLPSMICCGCENLPSFWVSYMGSFGSAASETVLLVVGHHMPICRIFLVIPPSCTAVVGSSPGSERPWKSPSRQRQRAVNMSWMVLCHKSWNLAGGSASSKSTNSLDSELDLQ